jgi:hypothetical protein
MMPNADGLDVAAGWQHVEDVTRHHHPLRDALRIDDRRLAGDGDRLLERADSHFRVHHAGEVGGELDLITLDDAEAGQREGDAVDAGSQAGDLVSAFRIGDGCADLFDQRRARHLDGDTRQDSAGSISNRSGDRARLRCCGAG